MAVPIQITVVDQNNAPVENVTVEVYDALGQALEDTQVTDPLGIASFNLVGGTGAGARWHVRVYQVPVGLFSPIPAYVTRKTLLVFEPAVVSTPNEFVIKVHTGVLEGAGNPHLCRVHAHVGFQDTFARKGYPLYVRTRYIPSVFYSSLKRVILSGDRIDLRTDVEGHAYVDLVRDGIYTLYIPDFMDTELTFVVPDQPYADLADLVFLYVSSLNLQPNPLILTVDEVQEVEIQNILFSDSRSIDCENNERNPVDYLQVDWLSGLGVANAVIGAEGKVTVTGLTAGTAVMGLKQKDNPLNKSPFVVLPTPPISHTPLVITVT